MHSNFLFLEVWNVNQINAPNKLCTSYIGIKKSNDSLKINSRNAFSNSYTLPFKNSFSNTSMWSQQKLNILQQHHMWKCRMYLCMHFILYVSQQNWGVCVVRRWTQSCDLFHLVNSLDDTLIDTEMKAQESSRFKIEFRSLLFSVQLTSHMFNSLPSHAVLHTTPTTHLIIMSITRFFLLETPVSFQKIIYIMFKIV